MEAATQAEIEGKPEHAVSSFSKSLFLGEIHEEMVFPWPVPDPDEQEKVRGLIRAAREIAGDQDYGKFEDERWIPDKLLRELGEAGLLGLYVDEKYGGQGLSQTGLRPCLRDVHPHRRDAFDRPRRPPVDRLQGDRALRLR